MKLNRHLATICLLLGVQFCWATQPLMDRVEFDGENIFVVAKTIDSSGVSGLTFIENEKTSEIRRNERCSAIGAPRGVWKIHESKLWLVGFQRCGGDIKLEDVYGGNGSPIFAEWVSADLYAEKGRPLCFGIPWSIREAYTIISIENGLLKGVSEKSNKGHPWIPTVETFLERMPKPITEDLKEEFKKAIDSGDVPCQTNKKL